jgi:hypothetical protein
MNNLTKKDNYETINSAKDKKPNANQSENKDNELIDKYFIHAKSISMLITSCDI